MTTPNQSHVSRNSIAPTYSEKGGIGIYSPSGGTQCLATKKRGIHLQHKNATIANSNHQLKVAEAIEVQSASRNCFVQRQMTVPALNLAGIVCKTDIDE